MTTPSSNVGADASRGLSVERTWTPPHIKADHVDGPLLVYSDGQLHWLTLAERIAFFFGLTDAARIQAKRRPTPPAGETK